MKETLHIEQSAAHTLCEPDAQPCQLTTNLLYFVVLRFNDVIGLDAVDDHGETLVLGALVHHRVDLQHEAVNLLDLYEHTMS